MVILCIVYSRDDLSQHCATPDCADRYSFDEQNLHLNKQQVCILDEKRICRKKNPTFSKKQEKREKPAGQVGEKDFAPIPKSYFYQIFSHFHDFFFLLRSAGEIKAKGGAEFARDDR